MPNPSQQRYLRRLTTSTSGELRWSDWLSPQLVSAAGVGAARKIK
jgi:hypothetical protein